MNTPTLLDPEWQALLDFTTPEEPQVLAEFDVGPDYLHTVLFEDLLIERDEAGDELVVYELVAEALV